MIEDDDQGFWRQMVERVWARAEKKVGVSTACAIPPSTANGRTNTSPRSLAATSSPTPRVNLDLGHRPGSGLHGGCMADESWRILVEAHWNDVGSRCVHQEPVASAEEVSETPSAGRVDPAPSLIEIDDEEDDADENREEGGLSGVLEPGAEQDDVPEVQDHAVGVREMIAGDARPSATGRGTAPVPVVDIEDSATFLPHSSAGAEFRSSFDDLPDELDGESPPLKTGLSDSAVRSGGVAVESTDLNSSALKPAAMLVPSSNVLAEREPAGRVSAAKVSAPCHSQTPASGKAQDELKHCLVDNSLLQAKTQGLGYRFSKRRDDIDRTATAAWGSTVVGSDEGDGWLRVGSKYLPMESSGKRVLTPKLALARTTSGTLFAPFAAAPASAARPAGVFIPRSGGEPGGLRRQGSWGAGAPPPAGRFVPRSPGPGGQRQPEPPEKRRREGPLGARDTEGRRYDLRSVVVNFANVGATYACKVLGRDKQRGDRLFDWEGVRRCVRHLKEELGLEVIGVVMENFWAPDNSKDYKIGIPEDIRQICDSIEETPKLQGRNHKSCDDEMTIKCAYRRSCRFMDNDNYRDWIKEMRNDRCRVWLEHCQEMLQMRYFFDAQLGTFDTLDGKIPAGLLASQKSQ